MQVVLDTCPHCGIGQASVVHALCVCPNVVGFSCRAQERGRLPSPSNMNGFLLGLFRTGESAEERAAHIEFVGKVIGRGCSPAQLDVDAVGDEPENDLVSAASFDAWLRLEFERAGVAEIE